jgi:tetratricopeptide (TPR) repeat protein
MAQFYQEQGRHREALNIYVYMINTFDESMGVNKACELYKAAGDSLLDLKEWRNAEKFLLEALRRSKSDQEGPIQESLGEAHFYLNEYTEAESFFKKALNACSLQKGSNAPECITIRANLDQAQRAAEPGVVSP